MRKLILLAGVAALAASMPALAKERDRGGGHGRGHAAQVDRHGGGHDRAERGRGRDREVRRNDRRGPQRAERRMNRQERRVERAIADERRIVRQARREDRVDRRGRGNGGGMAWRGDDDDRRFERRFVDRRDWNDWARRPVLVRRFDDDFVRVRPFQPVGFRGDGCPPGLAKQNRFCLPPGQLRRARFIGQRLPIAAWPYNVPVRYRYRFADGDRFFYRYGNDGTIYRFDRASGLVSAVVPVMSSGLFIGEPLPLGYDVYNVPFAYRTFYPDTSDYLYRYDGNAIYRVDADNRLVDGIVALLAGGGSGLAGLGVGDRLPLGYDAYNVPFAYRDTYYDTNDRMYRYADGSIYQVDPQTRLIESVISLLV